MRTPKGLPTASRLELAFKCAASQVLPVVDTEFATGEAGREKHAALEGTVTDTPPLDVMTEDTRLWLTDLMEHSEIVRTLTGSFPERAYAFDVNTAQARYLGHHLAWNYQQSPSEYAGAMDFVSFTEDSVAVIDLKTGQGDTPHPRRNHQLRFGAMTAAKVAGVDTARLGLLVAPAGRKPFVQWDELDAFGLAEVELELTKLADRIGYAREAVAKGNVPRLVVGEHCGNCKARHGCPARVAMAKRLVGEPEKVVMDLKAMLTPESANIAYQRWRAARKALDEVGNALHAYAKENPIPLGNGLVWGPKTSERDFINAEKAWPVLEDNYGTSIAKTAMTFKTSKAGLKRGMQQMREKLRGWPAEMPRPTGVPAGKVTLVGLEAEALKLLKKGGAIEKVTKTEYDEYPATIAAQAVEALPEGAEPEGEDPEGTEE